MLLYRKIQKICIFLKIPISGGAFLKLFLRICKTYTTQHYVVVGEGVWGVGDIGDLHEVHMTIDSKREPT